MSTDPKRYVKTLVVHRLDAYPDVRVPLLALYAAMQTANEAYLRAHPSTPPLLRSGVVYARESAVAEPGEVLRDIPSVRRDGWGDCDDLACWRAAELVVRAGRRAQVVLIPGGRAARYHAVVYCPDTRRIHDPSAKLGMRERSDHPHHRTRRTVHGTVF